jgi:hypothetical protein
MIACFVEVDEGIVDSDGTPSLPRGHQSIVC